MHIDVLASNTIKITLSADDMMDYSIDYETLSHKNHDTKRLLAELLATVKAEKDLDFTVGRLFIEAFPRKDGGCMIYISCLQVLSEKPDRLLKTSLEKNQIICQVEGIKELTNLCVHLNHCKEKTSSSIYSCKNKYRIILESPNAFSHHITHIIEEYGTVVGVSEIIVARTREFYTEIAKDNGIELISTTLGRVKT